MPTESQLRDAALRTLIRQRIDAGELPLMFSKTISVTFSGSSSVSNGRGRKAASARKLSAVQRRFS